MDLNTNAPNNLSGNGRKPGTVDFPIWVSVSEAAALGGVQHKTIRRAIKNEQSLRYRIVKNRYQIEIGSLILFLHKNKKLQNKLRDNGLGQYVKEWNI